MMTCSSRSITSRSTAGRAIWQGKTYEAESSDASSQERRQERFCQEYLLDLDQSAAYLRAGYKVKKPAQAAWNLMHRPGIQERIIELKAERKERTDIEADRVLGVIEDVMNRALGEEGYKPEIVLRAAELSEAPRALGRSQAD